MANWFEGDKSEDKSNWIFEGDTVATLPVSSIIKIWEHYRQHGGLPEQGGWLDQPLDVVVMIGVIQTVYETYQYKQQEKADWSKFTATQVEVIKQVERSALSG